MEQGPHLNLELISEAAPPQGPTLRRLLGAQELQGRVFPSASVEVLLEPGYAYILVGEVPQARWQTDDTGAEPAPTVPTALPAVGPRAAAPKSIGELILAGAADPPIRNLLVFVPRIPARLWQPYEAAADGRRLEEPVVNAIDP
jgi:hypothetical protein